MTDHVKAIVDGVRPMIEVVDAKAKALEARVDDLSAQVRERATASSLPGVEPKKFSFAKAIGAIKTGNWSAAGYEKEVFDNMSAKALRFGDGAQGGYLVPDEVRNDLFVGATRANNVLFQTNVLRVTSSGGAPIRIPKISSGHAGGWIGENGSNSAADQTYAEITLTPKRAFAATLMSNTLIRRDAASAEAVVRADLEAAVSEQLLKGYLNGGGANEPSGLTALSGTTSVTGSSSSALVVMQSLIRGLQKIEENQGDIAQCVFVMHPRVWYYLLSAAYSGTGTVVAATATATQQLPVGFASAVFGINAIGQKTIMGVPVYLTTAMTITNNAGGTQDTSTVLLYQPSNTIFAEFGPMELLVTNAGSTLGLADQTLVRVVQEVDFNARIAAQVVKITGMTAGDE